MPEELTRFVRRSAGGVARVLRENYMRFSELLKTADVTNVLLRGEAMLTGITSDSRQCAAGVCFVAVKGPKEDGHKYIPAAVTAGCSAVVCQDASAVPAELPCAIVPSAQEVVGALAQAFYGWPARKLTSIGVTGTKGKSTVTYLIRAILQEAGFAPALLGTISYETGLRTIEAKNTTPGPIDLAGMCAEMVSSGRDHLVMEVSSHALHQHRTDGVDFRVGVFTNLSGEHMDYHLTMENYLLAKQMLFEQLKPGATAVLNRDDRTGDQLARASGNARVVWYGLNSAADYWARIGKIDTSGSRFILVHKGRELAVTIPLIGRHNVYNSLAAIAACASLGVNLNTICRALEKVQIVPGRMERVNVSLPFHVFVDYAHTDDALDKALSAVRPLAKNKLIVVFGCGGDRDREKRPRMAKAAETGADRVIITSDNPRTEEPGAIIAEITTGLSPDGWKRSQVEADRRKAIYLALEQASEGDVVIIAGKGHEKYQIIGSQTIHFDDVEVVQDFARMREGRP